MANIYLDGANYLVEFDKDAENFIYVSGINNPANLNVDGLYTSEQAMYAVNYLVSGLKAIGVWDKMKAIYPFIGGTDSTHKWNLKDPRDLDAAFRITWSGATHNYLGFAGDNVNTSETYFQPAQNLSARDAHICAYYTPNGGVDGKTGVSGSSPQGELSVSSGGVGYLSNSTNIDILSTTVSGANLKSLLISDKSNDMFLIVNNNRRIDSTSSFGTGYPTVGTFLLGGLFGSGNRNSRSMGFLSIGAGLTNSEALQVSSLVSNFQGMLNRK
jgi:hypothetical protein